MSKNKNYYLVQIYDKVIYYKYVSNYKDENNYNIGTNFKCNDDSLSNHIDIDKVQYRIYNNEKNIIFYYTIYS